MGKMSNIAVLIGTGYSGEDVLHKLPWIVHLDTSHNIHVISRVNPDIHLDLAIQQNIEINFFIKVKESIQKLKNHAKTYDFIYDSPYLQKKYSQQELDQIQSWLGISFEFVASMDRRFFNNESHKDSRNPDSLTNNIAGLIQTYRNLFIENNIQILINTVEDDIFSTIGYYVAKKMNIEIIGLVNGRFPKSGIMLCKDFTNICIWNDSSAEFDGIKSLYDNNTISGKEVSESISENLKLSFVKILRGIHNAKKSNKSVTTIIELYPYEANIYRHEKLYDALKIFVISQIRSRIINYISDRPDYREKFYLFPIHYSEDAQITFREPFLDQFKLIYEIAKSLPYGYQLYVKPHPHYCGTDISLLKLLKLSKQHNVKIISHTIPPIELIQHAQGVITINSTTGFEALIMGKPVITFGHDFYCRDDIVHTIRDHNLLPGILITSLNDDEIKKEDINKFVSLVYSNTIWITGCEAPYLTFDLSDNDGKNIANALNIILRN
jgi:capsule polysaccharide modification protein KpsS